MHKKIMALFFLFALFSGINYASTTIQNANFGIEGYPASYALKTDIALTNDFSITRNGEDVTSDQFICPGSITINPQISSAWPTNAANFYALSPWPNCKKQGVDCPEPPIDYQKTINNPISWLSQSDFDNVRDNYYATVIKPDPILTMDSFHLQQVDYSQKAGVIDFPNKLGYTGIYCKGNLQLTITDPNGAEKAVSAAQMKSISSSTADLQGDGNYKISQDASGIQCLGAIEKAPFEIGTDYYQIIVYYQNPISFSLLQSRNINVKNVQSSLQLASATPSNNAPIVLPPKGIIEMKMDVVNNGDVTVAVTGASATNGFSIIPQCSSGFTGFDANIAKKGTQTICFLVKAPDNYNGKITTTISLQYKAMAPTCSAKKPDVKNYDTVYTFTPIGGISCKIDPATQTGSPGDTLTYGLTCTDEKNAKIPCKINGQDVLWSVNNVDAALSEQADDHAKILVNSAKSSGTLIATLNGGISCSAAINTKAGGIMGPACTISPGNVHASQKDTLMFNLKCIDNANKPVNCQNTIWGLNNVGANFVEKKDDSATLTITSDTDNGTINALTNNGIKCSANIQVGNNIIKPPDGVGESHGCQISPNQAYTHPNQVNTFSVSCPNNANQECVSPQWSMDQNFGTISAIPDTNVAFVKAGSNTGQAVISATTDGNTNSCTSVIIISEAICRDFI